jgi:hypothetical protein
MSFGSDVNNATNNQTFFDNSCNSQVYFLLYLFILIMNIILFLNFDFFFRLLMFRMVEEVWVNAELSQILVVRYFILFLEQEGVMFT